MPHWTTNNLLPVRLKIAKTMAAFANDSGGTLLVGVKDNQKVCGVKGEEEAYMLDLAARFFLQT